ncbi:hypothetical protein XOC_1044 [Xanthomonas oryzae pv. oryzicola BLS256]|uniref:Uncharacterized protein n=1 Tax=Xanthomonas oryzae pv. oryzicola (strain BLS256) TaxID=383407 RepID=G7TF77_XANOB|nr:hypothetical protein XOC_1044 [Xanthomonas oryzae pv. oryzicola BLS256]QEO98879.1 hypothetical protein XOCgx_3891 [Xanthomonas oryzae pv. oryzicola]
MSTFECTDIRFRENLVFSWGRARTLDAMPCLYGQDRSGSIRQKSPTCVGLPC